MEEEQAGQFSRDLPCAPLSAQPLTPRGMGTRKCYPQQEVACAASSQPGTGINTWLAKVRETEVLPSLAGRLCLIHITLSEPSGTEWHPVPLQLGILWQWALNAGLALCHTRLPRSGQPVHFSNILRFLEVVLADQKNSVTSLKSKSSQRRRLSKKKKNLFTAMGSLCGYQRRGKTEHVTLPPS